MAKHQLWGQNGVGGRSHLKALKGWMGGSQDRGDRNCGGSLCLPLILLPEEGLPAQGILLAVQDIPRPWWQCLKPALGFTGLGWDSKVLLGPDLLHCDSCAVLPPGRDIPWLYPAKLLGGLCAWLASPGSPEGQLHSLDRADSFL